MNNEFWLERWERQELGFHQDEINQYLIRYWDSLCLTGNTEIFVPMCGKSQDMIWLNEQGCKVLGVELSDIAVRDFFTENDLLPQRTSSQYFEVLEANDIRLFRGDYFALSMNELEKVTAVFDRASLVALPVDMRERYAMHMVSILAPRTKILLVAFDYPQSEMTGPPFAVSPGEVETLYGSHAEISLLDTHDVLEQNPRFKGMGLSRLHEHIFLLTLR
ncbi:MAG: thiopurine S-methyltransferase [Gallionella sp.]